MDGVMRHRSAATTLDRRTFLGSAAATAAGAGFALPARGLAAAAVPEKTEPLHVAVIGTGTQGQELMNLAVQMPGIRIPAISDIWTAYNLKRGSRLLAGHFHDHTTYADWRELLEKEKNLHAVIIATPDFCHAAQTVACLEAGLHVYCEAPIANTLEDARRMVRAARQAGKLLQIGQQRRSNPSYVHCGTKLLGELKLLGTVNALSAQWNRPVQPTRGWPRRYPVADDVLKKYGYASMSQFRNWRWYKALGSGPLGEFGCHQVDIFNWFLGTPPTSVLASAGTDYYDPKTHEWHDTVMAVYEYRTARGTARAFYQVLNTNGNLDYFEKVLGDQGAIVISEAKNFAAVYREEQAQDWDRWVNLEYLKKYGDEEETEDEEEAGLTVTKSVEPSRYDVPVTFTDPFHKPHLENFFNAVRGRGALACPAETAYQTAVTVFKVAEAAAAGRKLAFTAEDFTV
jgi:predicted dehydrogenase